MGWCHAAVALLCRYGFLKNPFGGGDENSELLAAILRIPAENWATNHKFSEQGYDSEREIKHRFIYRCDRNGHKIKVSAERKHGWRPVRGKSTHVEYFAEARLVVDGQSFPKGAYDVFDRVHDSPIKRKERKEEERRLEAEMAEVRREMEAKEAAEKQRIRNIAKGL